MADPNLSGLRKSLRRLCRSRLLSLKLCFQRTNAPDKEKLIDDELERRRKDAEALLGR